MKSANKSGLKVPSLTSVLSKIPKLVFVSSLQRTPYTSKIQPYSDEGGGGGGGTMLSAITLRSFIPSDYFS